MRTNAGRDHQARVMGNGAHANAGTGVMRPADYIALSPDTNSPSAASTTLPSEVVAGTLVRAQATYSHTDGQATYALSKTFVSDQTIVIAKVGVFNAPAAGTIVFETLLGATASLVSGDQILITETVTL